MQRIALHLHTICVTNTVTIDILIDWCTHVVTCSNTHLSYSTGSLPIMHLAIPAHDYWMLIECTCAVHALSNHNGLIISIIYHSSITADDLGFVRCSMLIVVC